MVQPVPISVPQLYSMYIGAQIQLQVWNSTDGGTTWTKQRAEDIGNVLANAIVDIAVDKDGNSYGLDRGHGRWGRRGISEFGKAH